MRIEDICWVLEAERLCEAVVGIPFEEYSAKRDAMGPMQARFDRMFQFSSFFLSELKLLSRMAAGRANNVVRTLEESFSYTMLVSLSKNEHLPSVIRGVSLDLLRVLYLDRYPQQASCGRPSIPELLWIYEAPEVGSNTTLPLIPRGATSLKDSESALPSFTLSPSHDFHGNPDPLLGFEGHTKFFLLRELANHVIAEFGSGRMAHSDRSVNSLAKSAVDVVANLLEFGFQSNYDKVALFFLPRLK